MKKIPTVLFVLLLFSAVCASAHEKHKAAPVMPKMESTVPEAKRPDMSADKNMQEEMARITRDENKEKSHLEPVFVLGLMTALCLITTALFSILKVPGVGKWLKWHKTFAYITLALMLIHGSLALYGHFFG